MRVLFAIGSLKYSGAERVLSALALHLAEAGNDVHVVVTLPDGDVPTGLPYVVHHAAADGLRPVRILRRAASLRRVVGLVAPDVTVSFGYPNNINSIPALLWNGVPHIACERNNPLFDPPGTTPQFLRRLLYPLASGFVFQTSVIRGMFSADIQRRSTVIPNPVIDPPSDAEISDAMPDARRRIVCIGRLSARDKNQPLLIRAFARLAERFGDWDLELFGDGPDHGSYLRLARDLGLSGRVRLEGFINDPYLALRKADIFALPSRTEGMPNALIEAMASGVPCVATDCSGGGAAALIEHGVNGLLCASDDEEGLVNALEHLMTDGALRESIGRAGMRIRSSHSMDTIAQAWLRMLNAYAR